MICNLLDQRKKAGSFHHVTDTHLSLWFVRLSLQVGTSGMLLVIRVVALIGTLDITFTID